MITWQLKFIGKITRKIPLVFSNRIIIENESQMAKSIYLLLFRWTVDPIPIPMLKKINRIRNVFRIICCCCCLGGAFVVFDSYTQAPQHRINRNEISICYNSKVSWFIFILGCVFHTNHIHKYTQTHRHKHLVVACVKCCSHSRGRLVYVLLCRLLARSVLQLMSEPHEHCRSRESGTDERLDGDGRTQHTQHTLTHTLNERNVTIRCLFNFLLFYLCYRCTCVSMCIPVWAVFTADGNLLLNKSMWSLTACDSHIPFRSSVSFDGTASGNFKLYSHLYGCSRTHCT